MILAVTGHRPDKLGGWKTPNPTYLAIGEAIDKALMELKPEFVITGMALGVDQWTAELCLDADIPFVAAVPFAGQERMWPPHAQERYAYLLSKAAQVVVVSPGEYDPKKMHLRNRWMVLNSDMLLAVWNGTPGGTAACVQFAQSHGHPIKFLDLPKNIPEPAPRVQMPKIQAVTAMDYDPMWNLYTPAAVQIPNAPKIPKPPKPQKTNNEPPGGGRFVDLGDDE